MITDQKAAPAAQPPATEPSEETLRAIEKVLLDGKNSDVPEYWKGVARPLALKLYEAAQPPAIGAASSDLLEYYWQLKRTEIIEAVERAGFRIVSRLGSVNLEPLAAAPTIATPPEATKAYPHQAMPRGLSWGDGFVIEGTDKSITEVRRLMHAEQWAISLQREIDDGALVRPAATPPEVAPTDDARAAGWREAVDFLVSLVRERVRLWENSSLVAIEDEIRALAASPAADTERE